MSLIRTARVGPSFVIGLALVYTAVAGPPAGFDVYSRGVPGPASSMRSAQIGTDQNTPASLRLLITPRVHSVSDTSANIEWLASLPAICEIGWGDSPECSNRLSFDFVRFGSYSLLDLQPGNTYYFQLRSIKLPAAPGAQSSAVQKLDGPPLSFTTLKIARPPRNYYVAPDGNDQQSGLELSQAWRTLQHAADSVGPGDTVHVAAGRYPESVRLRATGVPDRPISFKGVPGNKAVVDGADMALHQGFVVAGKSHLRFDGLYFAGHNRFRLPREFYWHPERPGDFNLYQGRDIVITRCLTDVDGNTSAPFILGWLIDRLVVRNCVVFSKMSGIDLYDCPDVQLEHNVFASPQITAFDLQNRADVLREKMALKARVAHNVFTDNLYKKAALNIGIYNHSNDAIRWENNCFFLRPIRSAHNQMTLEQYTALHESAGSIFVDPQLSGPAALAQTVLRASRDGTAVDRQFAQLVRVLQEHSQSERGLPPWWFTPDFLLNRNLGIEMDFNRFYTTNPRAQQAGIGLEPEAFTQTKVSVRAGQ